MDAADRRNPLMLIHGAWLSARSWENYADYFGHRGFAVSAPERPRKEGDVEEMRETAEKSASLGVNEIIDHYERLISELEQPPVLIGHSTVPASLSKGQYEKYEQSPAKTDYLEFEGRLHLHMVAEDWEEVATEVDSWLGGVLDAPSRQRRVRRCRRIAEATKRSRRHTRTGGRQDGRQRHRCAVR